MFRRFLLILGFLACFAPFCGAKAAGLSEQLRQQLAQPELWFGDKSLNMGDLNRFYAVRDYRGAWDSSGDNPAAMLAFLGSVQQLADYHGIDLTSYPLDLLKDLMLPANKGQVWQRELVISDIFIRLAYDIYGSRFDLKTLYPGWEWQRQAVDVATDLGRAILEGRLNPYLASLTPPHPAYAQLAAQLSIYRAIAARGGWPQISTGKTLRPNDDDPRIAQVRQRLIAESYLPNEPVSPADATVYDTTLQSAMVAYQERNGLEPDGNIGSRSLASMNKPVSHRINQIIANMERLRHLPDNFPPARHATVNIADASIAVIDSSKILYEAPVIVGRPDRKTPFIASEIRSLIFNPAWHVPSSIAKKDILPKLRKDPQYLEKLGFVIKGSADDPHGTNIDWSQIEANAFQFQLRQAPGEMNSLGPLKFDFDNDFAVYLHGTPHQELFEKFERHLSSGCVRVRDPKDFAVILLAQNTTPWSLPMVEDELANDKTRWLKIKQPLPLSILYWTAFMGADGKLNFRHDVYGYDEFLIQNLRKFAQKKPQKSDP